MTLASDSDRIESRTVPKESPSPWRPWLAVCARLYAGGRRHGAAGPTFAVTYGALRAAASRGEPRCAAAPHKYLRGTKCMAAAGTASDSVLPLSTPTPPEQHCRTGSWPCPARTVCGSATHHPRARRRSSTCTTGVSCVRRQQPPLLLGNRRRHRPSSSWHQEATQRGELTVRGW